MKLPKIILTIVMMTCLVPGMLEAKSFDGLKDVPVQHSGRIKPFETFAKETALYVTGKTKVQGLQATELLWRWMVEPDLWIDQPIIPVSGKELQKEFKVMMINHRLSAEIILNHEPFLELVREGFKKKDNKEKLLTSETKRLELYDKASLLKQIGQGRSPGWVARPNEIAAKWYSFQDMIIPEMRQTYESSYDEAARARFEKAVQGLIAGVRDEEDAQLFKGIALEFKESLYSLHQSEGVILNQKILQFEKKYNELKPFAWSWKVYLMAVILFILSLVFKGLSGKLNLPLKWAGIGFFTAGFILHSYGFLLRCLVAGRPPVSNMYESIVWVSWAIVFFSAILAICYKTNVILIFSGLVATFCLVIAQSFPALFDPFISPLVPVLRSNLWLSIHVLTITLSYGAFALAWGIGHGALFTFAFKRNEKELQETYTLYLYRAVQIGVVLLAAGTVLGGVWANYSWGRFWGWDPKETWALIALLGYIFVLHGRFSGWLGPFGFTVGTVIAFLGVLIAWYGVNYVLAAGLHSYGFGGGGVQYVLGVVLFDFLLIGAAALRYKKGTR